MDITLSFWIQVAVYLLAIAVIPVVGLVWIPLTSGYSRLAGFTLSCCIGSVALFIFSYTMIRETAPSGMGGMVFVYLLLFDAMIAAIGILCLIAYGIRKALRWIQGPAAPPGSSRENT